MGKAGEGRLEPVTASSQRGRRGLGHIIEVNIIGYFQGWGAETFYRDPELEPELVKKI